MSAVAGARPMLDERGQRQRRAWLATVVIGILGSAISALRLWLANRQSLSEILWAEDGLFPLCIDKQGFIQCLIDPFAGYLLFLPRLLALPVSLAPIEMWAVYANVIASILVGSAAAVAYSIARRYGLGVRASFGIGLMPAIAPLVGFEAIQSIGSAYILLLYVSTLLIVLPSPELLDSRWRMALSALLMLLTALTMPLAALLLPVVVAQWRRKLLSQRHAVVLAVALLVGLGAQFFVVVGAEMRRPLAISLESFMMWANTVPNAILTFWPGLSFSEYRLFDIFALAPSAFTGLFVVSAMVVVSVALMMRGMYRELEQSSSFPIGALVLMGLAYGLLPVLIGNANNRYFVLPILLWAAALLVFINPWLNEIRRVWIVIITVVVLVIWWPAIPASPFRSTPLPAWSTESARTINVCAANPNASLIFTFTPDWPGASGGQMPEPTNPSASCKDLS